MATCPECDSDIDVDEYDVDKGDLISCPECGTNLEVVNVSPLEFEATPEDDDDDDLEDDDLEDEDDEDSDDEDDEDDDEDGDKEDWEEWARGGAGGEGIPPDSRAVVVRLAAGGVQRRRRQRVPCLRGLARPAGPRAVRDGR